MAASITTVGGALQYAEYKANIPSGTLNNATNGIGFFNDALQEFRTDLIKRGVDGAQLQEAYVPSISAATPPTASIFAFPSDMYFLKAIEVNFTDTTQQNYLRANQVDIGNTTDGVSYDWLRVNQPVESPMFDSRGDTYEIFPSFLATFNLTNAIKIFYYLQPIAYTATSSSLTYPDTLDPYILSLKTNALYYESLGKFNESTIWDGKYTRRLEKLVDTIGRGAQQETPTAIIRDTGYSY